jgi:hypothetical protein
MGQAEIILTWDPAGSDAEIVVIGVRSESDHGHRSTASNRQCKTADERVADRSKSERLGH